MEDGDVIDCYFEQRGGGDDEATADVKPEVEA